MAEDVKGYAKPFFTRVRQQVISCLRFACCYYFEDHGQGQARGGGYSIQYTSTLRAASPIGRWKGKDELEPESEEEPKAMTAGARECDVWQ